MNVQGTRKREAFQGTLQSSMIFPGTEADSPDVLDVLVTQTFLASMWHI